MTATRSRWKTTPLPEARQALPFERSYSREEFERLAQGHVPQEMEDKWFVFYEQPWLYLHRSWTGLCIYQVRFEQEHDSARVVEALSNRDPDQYKETDAVRDMDFLSMLLDGYAGRPRAS